MASSLQDKVSFALNETRMLILGVQVLIGFEYEVFFEKKFEETQSYSQDLQIVSLLLLVVTIVLLIAPTIFHRMLGADCHTEHVLGFTTNIVGCALYPFALALGISIYCCLETVIDPLWAAMAGTILIIAALWTWFLGPYLAKRISRRERKGIMNRASTLEVRLQHVLTEARVMLPGAQALLGFQLIIFFMEGFATLAKSAQWVHAGSLLFIAATVIMLVSPAAFHRIADSGEIAERSYRFANSMVLFEAIPLGLGLAGDLYVVLIKASIRPLMALIGSSFILLVSYGLWFGYSTYVRGQVEKNDL